MEQSITISQLLELIAIIGAIWGFYKVAIEIIKAITEKHDREQKWDEYDAQIKVIRKEQCLITYCMMATLDGLHQLGANGEVTIARDKLNKHVNEQAHGE